MPADARTRYRASDLAEAAGISVQLLRSYQSKGLLPAPIHEGRIAWYGSDHLERLEWIRDLKARGYSLKMIHAAVLEDEGSPSTPAAGLAPPPEATLRLRDVAERSGLPAEMLRAFEASHLLRPHRIGRAYRYTEADVRAVRQVLTLIGVGMSLEEFLAIADPQLATADQLAADAVAVWMRKVVSKLHGDAEAVEANTGRLVASVRVMSAAIAGLITYNVERAVLNAAQAAIANVGEAEWSEAITREVSRRHPDVAV